MERRRASLLVYVTPPALAIFAALYSVEHRAIESDAPGEPLGRGKARIFGQLIGPEDRPAPPGIEVYLLREDVLSESSPSARRCCEGCALGLFDERCERAAQTIAELVDDEKIELRASRVAITGSTGWFEHDSLPPDRYAVYAAAPRGAIAFVRNVEVEAFEQREVRLESGFRASLQGTVITSDGDPFPGAIVRAIDPRIGRIFSAKSDRDGRFELRDVDPSIGYYVLARAKELAPRGRSNASADEDLLLELEEAAAIAGQITFGGKPLDGAIIELDELAGHALTASDGKFRFDELTPGYHVLRASSRGNLGRRLELQVPRGETRNVQLELAEACTLRVRVEDSEGAPIAGADVRLLGKESIDHRAQKTDDEGTALFEMMTLGHYELDARRSDRGKVSSSLLLESGCISRSEKLVIRDSAGIRGRIAGEDGKPLADVELSLEFLDAEADSADAVRLSRTNGKGRFRVPSLAPGRWQLTAFKEGFVETSQVLELGGAEDDDNVEVVLSRGGTIAGRIIDLSERPVSNWTVHARAITREGDTEAVDISMRPTSGEDGGFVFSGLHEGRYELRAEPPGAGERDLDLGGAVTSTVVAHTGDAKVTLRAPATGALAGFIEFIGAPPPESFSVILPGLGARAFDGLSGRFYFPAAIAASYPIVVRARGFSDAILDVEVAPHAEVTVEVLLEAAVRLRGRVIDAADGQPIAEATVAIGERFAAATRKDGRFEIRGLPPGEHVLSASALGYGRIKLGPLAIEGGVDAPDLEARLERANVHVRGRVRAGRAAPSESAVFLALREGSEVSEVFEANQANNRGEFKFDALPPGEYALIVAARLKDVVEIQRSALKLPTKDPVEIDFASKNSKSKLWVELVAPREIPALITLRPGKLDERAAAGLEAEHVDPAQAILLADGEQLGVFEHVQPGSYTLTISEVRADEATLRGLATAALENTRIKYVEVGNESPVKVSLE